MKKEYKKIIVSLLLAVSFVFSSCGKTDPKAEENDIEYNFVRNDRGDMTNSPTVDQLVYDGEWQERWLAIPESRLVLNPVEFYNVDSEKPQSHFVDSNKLPFNLGYLSPYTSRQEERQIFNEFMILLDSGDITEEAKSYSTWWSPAVTGFEAEYNSGMKIEGKDYFYDEKTIIRNITYTGDNIPLIGGCINKYNYRKDGNSIIVEADRYTIAISFNADFNLKFYEGYIFALRGLEGKDVQPNSAGAYWIAEFTNQPENNNIIASVSVDSDVSSAETVRDMAVNAAKDKRQNKVLKDRCDEWNEFLAKVPRPGTFEFETIDSKGVTSLDVDRMYYTAWSLIYSSLLPPAPEVGFNYRQISAGKPSMWADGQPTAAFTAAWDSIYGYHMFAFIDPEIAWECLTGLMTLIEKSDDPNIDGMIEGESLPLNRARTAWLLYQMNPDKDKLRNIFDALDRNLYWGMNHPYWIYRNNNPLDSKQKDPSFTSSILVDMQYMIKICEELGESDCADKWQNYKTDYLKMIPKWHVTTTIRKGQKYQIAGGHHPIWVTKMLYSPDLSADVDQAFINLFEKEYDINKPFVGFNEIKLEETAYTICGLYDNGYAEYANSLNESVIREIVISEGLGEHYRTNFNPPRVTGVVPSMFGAVLLITSVWNRNGFRYDTCTPSLQNFMKEGSMDNIHFGDKVFGYSLKDGKVTLSGNLKEDGTVIEVPENKVVSLQ